VPTVASEAVGVWWRFVRMQSKGVSASRGNPDDEMGRAWKTRW
jgi:hypothetical protein